MISVILSLFFSLSAQANPTIVGTIDHADFENFATVAVKQTGETICIIATATRHPQGAATTLSCYVGDKAPSLEATNSGAFKHGGNIVNTVFMVIDSANDIKCTGSIVTRASRSKTSDRDWIDQSGASISMDCI